MRFLAIDLETTGLLPEEHQILQIGVVIGDFRTPNVEDLPRWECIIAHEEIKGHPFALAMNADLISKIARRDRYPELVFFDSCNEAYRALHRWLVEEQTWLPAAGLVKAVAAGKNVAGFDIPFLRAGGDWDSWFQLKHRVLDPGPLYFTVADKEPPDLQQCLGRAGIDKEVEHTGVADALDVVRLLRHKYGMEEEEG